MFTLYGVTFYSIILYVLMPATPEKRGELFCSYTYPQHVAVRAANMTSAVGPIGHVGRELGVKLRRSGSGYNPPETTNPSSGEQLGPKITNLQLGGGETNQHVRKTCIAVGSAARSRFSLVLAGWRLSSLAGALLLSWGRRPSFGLRQGHPGACEIRKRMSVGKTIG